MDFFEVIKKRHCCRSFKAKQPVADDLIEKIIAAGKAAPSAGGIYPIDFLVIKDEKTKEKISEICGAFNQSFMNDAPLLIIIIGDVEKAASHYGERGRDLYLIQDGAAAAENAFLAATALGLGCCWIGAFDEDRLKEILKLKPNQRPMVIFPIGYQKE